MFGHSSTIRALDWSQDGRVLRSSSADYEIMYWSPRGKVPPPSGTPCQHTSLGVLCELV